MKKLKLVGILAAVVLIGGVVSIPLINNHTAYKVEKTLCEIPLPEETEVMNGNVWWKLRKGSPLRGLITGHYNLRKK